jgi:serine/threonine protein phosphatase PrpC
MRCSAFGDMDYKHPFNCSPGHFVIAEPHTRSYPIDECEFIILACDGLWDKLTYQDACNLTVQCLAQNKSPAEISEYLAKESLDRGSLDNITVIVVLKQSE